MLSKSVLTFACVLFCAVAFGASAADTPSGTAPGAVKAAVPWEQAFAAFADEDASHPHPAGGVLFVGSSSIRLWSDLQDQFKDLPVVINRGFGGSELADCVKNLNRLVIRYRPSTVLVYAGDNDLAAGTTPQEVLHRFTAFVEGVRRELPETRIAYISIKPSPLRIGLLPQIRADECADPRLHRGARKGGVHRRVHADARQRGQATHRALPRRFAAPQRRRLRALEARHRTPRALTSAAAFGRATADHFASNLLPPSVARAIA